ncbi:hypothetical protein OAK62_06205 [Deltaproteobacteria bacterium]|nr:hypothetical protein [Deltaproteobacteria bacterium]
MIAINLSKSEQYGLWDEYCKLFSEIENEEEFFENSYELEEQDFDECPDYEEDFGGDYDQLSVYDLAPEGMGYEYWSDDEFLGDVGFW